jgi:hypothetical protein
MKTVIIILLGLHGLIHLIGFTQAFDLANRNPEAIKISKPHGILWFLCTVCFVSAGLLLLQGYKFWWLIIFPSVAISQILILVYWKDARIGTIPNLLMVLIALTGYAHWNFKENFDADVARYLSNAPIENIQLTEHDLLPLPFPVQQYIRQSGAVDKPKVKNFTVSFDGKIRKSEESRWMPFESEQYNFMDSSARLFFMEATMLGLPVSGYHKYVNGKAFMDIRLLSTFRVQYETGPEMGIAETVTFFNDMCGMAPATLIDKRIEWLETDSLKIKARFTNNNISITAWLYFNEQYELVNFISDDRYALGPDGTLKQHRWSTPMTDYHEIMGHRLATSAETNYHYPNGDLTYGMFRLVRIEDNVRH